MHSAYIMNRRHFVRAFSAIAVYSSLRGNSWTETRAMELRPLTTSNAGTLRLKLADFSALQSESGSVRLAINPLRGGPPSGPTPNGQFYPVIINRGPADAFHALNSRCTHQGCVVEAMDASSNRMTCLCHGSVFGIDGRRLAGPAGSALAKYSVKFDGQGEIEVQIPNLAYSVTISSVLQEGAANGRLRLSFPALRNVSYEVQFRGAVDQPSVAAPFSTTVDGALDRTVFTPTSNTTANLFVERTSAAGFYAVAVVVSEI